MDGIDNHSTATASNPIAPGSNIEVHGLWRDKRYLIVHPGAMVPARCLKCDAWTERPPRSVYIRHFPKENILLILLLIAAPFTVVFWKRVYIEVVLCGRHLLVEKVSLATAWVLVLGSFVVFGL